MGFADEEVGGRRWKTWLGYGFAAACLAWVFHDIHPQRLLAAMTIQHWTWVVAAVGFDILTYGLQGMRWARLLQPAGRMGALRATQAIYVGLFANDVAPLRVGELIRAYLAARWLGAPLPAIVPSVLVERLLDAVWLVLAIGAVAIVIPLPRELERAADVFGIAVVCATGLFVWLVLRRTRGPAEAPSPARSRLLRMLPGVGAGIGELGALRHIGPAATISAGMLVCQVLALWFMMLAFGLRLPLVAGAAVFVVVRLGTAIPNAPANVGSFQFFTVVGLAMFGVDKATAAAFSLVDFAVLTVPLWALGLVALTRAGLSLGSLKKDIWPALRQRPL